MNPFPKLKASLADLSDTLAALEALDKAEREARAEVEKASRAGDALSDAAVDRLTRANAKLSIVPHNRTRLNGQLAIAGAGLREHYRTASNHYSKFISALIEAEYAKLCELLAPWYGSAHQVRRQTSEVFIPRLVEMRRTLYFSGGDTPTAEAMRDEARGFLRHVEKHQAETKYPVS